jgi:thiol-disulfide isomerase/thioredoxin
MTMRLSLVATIAGALAVGLAGPLRAGWGDDPRPPAPPTETKPAEATPETQPAPDRPASAVDKPVVADNPSWDKYAFSLRQAEGNGNVRFVDLARAGKPFVLVWWLSDCPVCNMQMPYVQQLARLGEDKSVDVQVVGINIDTEDRDCTRYLNDKKLCFETLRDPRGRLTDGKYGVRDEGTPMVYVFKAGGEYAGKLSGYTKNFPARVLGMLGIEMPEQKPGSGVTVERADGTRQQRSFN